MVLVERYENVRPVRVSQVCGCRPEGTALVLRAKMAGYPPRFIYDCPVCKHPYYLEKEAITIEYRIISGTGA